jgi:hypothetical protein
MMESLTTVNLGDKLLETLEDTGALPAEVAARLAQKDLTTHIIYRGEDPNGDYRLAWLAERCITTLPECLKQDLRFQHQRTYQELTLTASSSEVALDYSINFYQDLYPALYHKLQDSPDKQLVVKVCFTQNRLLREVGFGPYEEIAFIPQELSTIALTCVDAEAYYHFLKKDHLEVEAN